MINEKCILRSIIMEADIIHYTVAYKQGGNTCFSFVSGPTITITNAYTHINKYIYIFVCS